MATIRNIHKLVEFFSSFTVLPIDPDDVRDQIVGYGVKDEIEFFGVDLDTQVLLGAIHHYAWRPAPYAERVVCADIYYDKSLPRNWRRLIFIKEMLHLLDHSSSRISTREDCERLASDIAGLDVSKPISEEAFKAWGDTLMVLYAAAIALPWDARELLRAQVPHKISIPFLAQKADLPEEIVNLVMSDGWPMVYDVIAGIK